MQRFSKKKILTPRFLMALFRSFTTSMPSTPLALNFFVHVTKTAYKTNSFIRSNIKLQLDWLGKSEMSLHWYSNHGMRFQQLNWKYNYKTFAKTFSPKYPTLCLIMLYILTKMFKTIVCDLCGTIIPLTLIYTTHLSVYLI